MMTKNVFTLICLLCLAQLGMATNYYFSATSGNDKNTGTQKAAFKSLAKIQELSLKAGDKILLKKGETFYGAIGLQGLHGTKNKPIVIASYGKANAKPIIDAKGLLNGILIQDCSYIKVDGIEITANGGGLAALDRNKRYMRCGVFITTKNKGEYKGILLENLFVRDVFFEEPGISRSTAEKLSGNGTQNYGWGIRIINSNKKALLSEITIRNCHVKNVSHSGIRFTGNHALSTKPTKNIQNVEVLNNQVEYVGGPALQASVVKNIVFRGNKTDHSGSPDDDRKWGRGSGLWVWGCLNATIEHNAFRHANGPGDSAGCHIDFNNTNVIIQYNISENNAGGFVEILGNNNNCTYRYNVSINDGSRKKIKDKTLGAGTMIGINGYVGAGKKPIGPFNTYIYNNTVYVKKGINPEVGFSKNTKGVFIANNIFYLEGHAAHDHRKQFLPQSGPIEHVVFKNNLYLKADNWPQSSQVMITDSAPLFGNPEFENAGGTTAKDYTPKNKKLIKNKGIKIYNIPNDSIGLRGGFKPKRDILGKRIKGRPDMGAIEL